MNDCANEEFWTERMHFLFHKHLSNVISEPSDINIEVIDPYVIIICRKDLIKHGAHFFVLRERATNCANVFVGLFHDLDFELWDIEKTLKHALN